jgi:uncharacterized protein YcaQ
MCLDVCTGLPAERKQGVLALRGLWLEDNFSVSDEFTAALAARLRDFARFNGCEEVQLSDTSRGKEIALLTSRL